MNLLYPFLLLLFILITFSIYQLNIAFIEYGQNKQLNLDNSANIFEFYTGIPVITVLSYIAYKTIKNNNLNFSKEKIIVTIIILFCIIQISIASAKLSSENPSANIKTALMYPSVLNPFLFAAGA